MLLHLPIADEEMWAKLWAAHMQPETPAWNLPRRVPLTRGLPQSSRASASPSLVHDNWLW